MKTTNTIARRVMIIAHAFRREAAARYGCRISEICWSECLKQVWNAVKTRPEWAEQCILKMEEKKVEEKVEEKAAISEINSHKVNENGFVVFQNRNWNYRGDKNTWARVNGDKLIVNIGKGVITSEYEEELEAFLAPYNLKITTGRVTVAL